MGSGVWIAAVGLLLLLVGKLAVFIFEFSRQVAYLKAEIRRADSDRERRHWERELKVLYLSQIPGISTERAVRIVRRGKRKK